MDDSPAPFPNRWDEEDARIDAEKRHLLSQLASPKAPSKLDEALAMQDMLLTSLQNSIGMLGQKLDPILERIDRDRKEEDEPQTLGSSILLDTLGQSNRRIHKLDRLVRSLAESIEL